MGKVSQLDRLYRPLTAGDRDRIAEHYARVYRRVQRLKRQHADELNLRGYLLLEVAEQAARKEAGR